jgi:hypothetical protein
MAWFPPMPWIKKNEFHGNREWTTDIHNRSGNMPVVFIDTYQKASKYWFYSGMAAFSLNSPYYRRNNFNMWPVEDSLIGKAVYMDVPDDNEYFRRLFKPHGWPFPQDGVQQNFYSFSRVLFTGIECAVLKKGAIKINTKAAIPDNYMTYFHQAAYSQTPIWLVLYENGDVKTLINTGTNLCKLTNASLELAVNIPAEVAAGKYSARLCIGTVLPGFPTINSTEFELCVE